MQLIFFNVGCVVVAFCNPTAVAILFHGALHQSRCIGMESNLCGIHTDSVFSKCTFTNAAQGAAVQMSGTLDVCKAVGSSSMLATSSASSVTMSIYVVAIAVLAGHVQLLAL